MEWKTLGEIGTLKRGNGLQKKDFTQSGVGCIHYGQIYTFYGTFAHKTKSFVSDDLAPRLTKVNYGDIIITTTSENVSDVCKAVAWLGNEIVTGGHAAVLTHNENPKYISYCLQSDFFFKQKKKFARGTKVIEISTNQLAKIKIPVPDRTAQDYIVRKLDSFDELINDLFVGLPAEINARKKQYEYYRNKLLTFKEKSA